MKYIGMGLSGVVVAEGKIMKPPELVILIMGAESFGEAEREIEGYRREVLEEAKQVATEEAEFCKRAKGLMPGPVLEKANEAAIEIAEHIAAEIEKLKGER